MMQNGTIQEIWESELALKADGTQRKYLEKFNAFLVRWETTPEELYEARLSDLRSGDPLKFRRIEKMVETQMNEIVRGGLSASTAQQLKKAVSLFFEAVNMPLKMKAKNMPNGDYLGQRMMRADQQRELIGALNRLNKNRNTAILTTLKDSGLRVSDVSALTLEAYNMAETVYNEIGEPFKVFDPEITKKCKVRAFIHLGPESIKAIDEYLEERKEKGRIEGFPSLFINRKNEAYAEGTMGRMIAHQCKARGKKFNKLSAHSFRKFHRTMLQKGRVPDSWIDKLQGKTVDTYSRPEEGGAPEENGDLTQAYIDAYNHLRIFKVPAELAARKREVEELRIDNMNLARSIPDLVREMAELRAELKALKAQKE